MRRATLLTYVIALLAIEGCSSTERSRSQISPATPAATIAQQVCSACHGTAGNATNPSFPSLAAQTASYTEAQLKRFRLHKRFDPSGYQYMWGLSKTLTGEQVKGLAAYYAVQKASAPEIGEQARADAALLPEGRAIYGNGLPDKGIAACASCHGDKAQGNESVPRLAYQHADYLRTQLLGFQRTDERPQGQVMKTVSHDLGRRDIRAVAIYLEQFPD